MRRIQNIVISLFVLVLLAFVGTFVYDRMYVDRTPPVITCDSDVIDVSVKDRQELLLRGVRATDEQDGDLTSEIILQGVTKLITSDTAKATYMVFDSANNMATMTRTVHYTDYEKPRIYMKEPLIFNVAETVSLLGKITAEDVIDGDISENVRVITQNISSNYEGVYSATVQVMNSLGDIESLPLKVVINNASAFRPLIKLRDYIVYIDKDAAFEPYSYITSVKNIAGEPVDKTEVTVDSAVNTHISGSYDVCYSYTSQHQQFAVYMTVVVK